MDIVGQVETYSGKCISKVTCEWQAEILTKVTLLYTICIIVLSIHGLFAIIPCTSTARDRERENERERQRQRKIGCVCVAPCPLPNGQLFLAPTYSIRNSKYSSSNRNLTFFLSLWHVPNNKHQPIHSLNNFPLSDFKLRTDALFWLQH